MKNLGIILTLAVVACVFHTSSGSNVTTTQAPATTKSNVTNAAQATTAPDITVSLTMKFNGAWNPTYSEMSHPNTTALATAICNAIKNTTTTVKECQVNSFSAGSIVADMTLTAAGTETSATVTNNVDSVKATISVSVTTAGFKIGTITGIADTTSTATAAPSTATTLSPSVIMYLTVLCAAAKVVLF